ncbi:Protein of unknown function [Gryllus bimaculatus]|nr:Protein of unknown function [Gryllus bimaculatus]
MYTTRSAVLVNGVTFPVYAHYSLPAAPSTRLRRCIRHLIRRRGRSWRKRAASVGGVGGGAEVCRRRMCRRRCKAEVCRRRRTVCRRSVRRRRRRKVVGGASALGLPPPCASPRAGGSRRLGFRGRGARRHGVATPLNALSFARSHTGRGGGRVPCIEKRRRKGAPVDCGKRDAPCAGHAPRLLVQHERDHTAVRARVRSRRGGVGGAGRAGGRRRWRVAEAGRLAKVDISSAPPVGRRRPPRQSRRDAADSWMRSAVRPPPPRRPLARLADDVLPSISLLLLRRGRADPVLHDDCRIRQSPRRAAGDQQPEEASPPPPPPPPPAPPPRPPRRKEAPASNRKRRRNLNRRRPSRRRRVPPATRLTASLHAPNLYVPGAPRSSADDADGIYILLAHLTPLYRRSVGHAGRVISEDCRENSAPACARPWAVAAPALALGGEAAAEPRLAAGQPAAARPTPHLLRLTPPFHASANKSENAASSTGPSRRACSLDEISPARARGPWRGGQVPVASAARAQTPVWRRAVRNLASVPGTRRRSPTRHRAAPRSGAGAALPDRGRLAAGAVYGPSELGAPRHDDDDDDDDDGDKTPGAERTAPLAAGDPTGGCYSTVIHGGETICRKIKEHPLNAVRSNAPSVTAHYQLRGERGLWVPGERYAAMAWRGAARGGAVPGPQLARPPPPRCAEGPRSRGGRRVGARGRDGERARGQSGSSCCDNCEGGQIRMGAGRWSTGGGSSCCDICVGQRLPTEMAVVASAEGLVDVDGVCGGQRLPLTIADNCRGQDDDYHSGEGERFPPETAGDVVELEERSVAVAQLP